MKKFFLPILIVLLFTLVLVACNDNKNTNPAHVHTPGAWVTVKAPSCEDGEQCQFCVTCGKVLETVPIAATGVHKKVVDEAVVPTCTSTGLTEGLHCMSCGKTFVAQIEIPKIAHSYDDSKDATCNTCDFVRDVTCKHTDVTVLKSKDATCNEAGLTEGIVCNGCEEILQVQQMIDALGHNEIVDYGYNATCTTAGLTEGKHCDRCNEVLVAQSYIKALGHNETEWVIEKEPTETEDGYKYKTCRVCQEKTQEEVIPFVGDLCIDYAVNEDGETCTVTGIGTFSGTKLDIPDYIREYKVTAIAENAFADCVWLGEINLPETVETIGTRAFYGCTGITEITIPASVKSIGNQIFYRADNLQTVYYNSTYVSEDNNFMSVASIKKVVFGSEYISAFVLLNCANVETVEILSNATSIGSYAFYNCSSLKSINIPDSVTSIGIFAFDGCSSLTSINIPDSVTSIGSYAFAGCSSLKDVYYTGDLKDWFGISFSDLTSNPMCFGANLYLNEKLVTDITIPDTVPSINSYAFYNCSSLTSINIPDSVTIIGNSAFEGCSSLTSINIPDSVTIIGNSAFEGCSLLASIYIQDTVTSIGSRAFYGCSNLTVYCDAEAQPSGWDSDWNKLNYNDNKVPVVWRYDPDPFSKGLQYTLNSDGQSYSVTSIGTCNHINITIPETYEGLPVTSIGDAAFSDCSLFTSIVIPNTIMNIGSSAFAGCSSLTSIIIPSGVTSINKGTFANCSSLTSIDVPEGVTTIGDSAFAGCSSLRGKIYIPDSVMSVGSSAFSGCSSLRSIIIPNSVTSIGSSAFFDCSSLIIYCEAEALPSGWKSDWDQLDSDSKVQVIWNNTNEVYGSITFDSIFKRTSFSATQQVWNAPGITVINNKCEGLADIADYYDPVRFYYGTQLIIIANDILRIQFICNNETYAESLAASLPIGTEFSISGCIVTITFTEAVDSFEIPSLKGGQVRVDSIIVYGVE